MGFFDGSTLRIAAILLGLAAVGVVAFVVALPWIAQAFIRLMLMPRYTLKRVGLENLPRTGPVLLLSNHVTWFDGFFIAAALPRKGTALVNTGVFGLPVVGYLARRCGLIPIPFAGPKGQRVAIEAARKALDQGNLLCIFPEGQLSRTGMTGPFRRGFEVILKGHETVPVIPLFLDNVWGSLLSYSEGRCLRKWPRGWRRTVIIAFGPPIQAPVTEFRARQAVLVTSVAARSAMTHLPGPLDTVDPSLPHFDHPDLGPLTGSTLDVILSHVQQLGQKPGTVGQALPGIAIQVVDEDGHPRLPDLDGRLQALLPGRSGWVDLGRRGRLDRDGFVTLT